MTPPTGATTARRARTSLVRVVVALVAGLLAVPMTLLTASPASAKLAGTPAFNITSVPAQDSINIMGATAGQTYKVELLRHGAVVSSRDGLVPFDMPKTPWWDGAINVNQVLFPCWSKVTPDVRAGDLLRVTSSGGELHESHVADVEVLPNPSLPSTAVVDAGNGIMEVHGRAAEADGTPIPVAQLGAQVLLNGKNTFTATGRNIMLAPPDGFLSYDPVDAVSNPDGTRWTARWFGVSAVDIQKAQNLGHADALWLGRDPIAETEMTINESSFLFEGVCTPKAPDVVVPPKEAVTGDTTVRPLSFIPAARIAGASSTFTGTITNPGPGAVRIAGFRTTGTDATAFSVPSTDCAVLAVKASCSVTVQFDAAGDPGPRTAELVIDDDVAGVVTVPLTSTVDPTPMAVLTASTPRLVFNDQAVGTRSPAATVTITNAGQIETSAPVPTVVGLDAADYTVAASTCAAVLSPGGTCDVSLEFAPTATGQRVASLAVGYENLPGQAATLTVPITAFSSVTADGYNDPPRRHLLAAWPERDAFDAWRFAPDELVDVELLRPDPTNGGALVQVAHADAIIPTDDPRKAGFDGSIFVNQLLGGATTGGVSWAPETPDMVPGDVLRTTAWKVGEYRVQGAVPTSREQTTVADVLTTSKPSKVSNTSFAVTGWARNPRTGEPLAADSIEVRVVAPGAAKFLNGTATLRAGPGLPNSTIDIRPDGTFTATFVNVGSFDLNLALTSMSMSMWLGRFPLVELETTASEFGSLPGPAAPTMAPQPLGQLAFPGECATCLPTTKVGAAAVGATGPATSVVVSNVGDAPTTITDAAFTGLEPGEFVVTGGTCVGATVPRRGTCTVDVAVRPTSAGLHQATLMVRHTGANPVELRPVEGIGAVAPVVTSVSPGLVVAGGLMFVNGSRLSGVNRITVGGVDAAGVGTLNDSTATAIMPSLPYTGAAVDVTVTTPGGSATLVAAMAVPHPAPQISGTVLPPAPVLVGQTVVVTGAWLGDLVAVSVSGVPATWSVNPDGSISVTLPQGTPPSAQIDVVGPGGSAATLPFDVSQPARLDAVSPSSASTGETVALSGAGLTGATEVLIDRVPAADLVVLDDFTVTVTMPALSLTGLPVDVSITTPTGTAVLSAALTAVLPVPAVTDVVLPPAPVLAGKSVTLTGTNLAAVTSVSVSGIPTTFQLNPDGTLAVVLPAGTPAAAQIDVVAPGGSSASMPIDVVQPPQASAVAPISAKAGDVVTFTGTNLGNLPTAPVPTAGVTSVTFTGANPAGVVAAVVRVSATTMRVTVPAGARPGPVTFAGPAGRTTFDGLAVLLPPAVTGVALPAAPVLAGKVVTVRGTALRTTVTSVALGAVTLPHDVRTVAPALPNGWRFEPNGTISVRIPAGTPASVALAITGAGGTVRSAAFGVVQPPQITLAAPASVRVGATVTFTGTNLGNVPTSPTPLAGVTSIRFNGPNGTTVAATSITRSSATQLRVVVPTGARTGPVTITGPAGTSTLRSLTVLP